MQSTMNSVANQLDTPVLLCVFNRPDLTSQVFQAIAKQRPARLLIAADGARPNVAGEIELVRQTRQVVEKVNWDCDVQTWFRDENAGCRQQMAEAITWGFQECEKLIILEDDCLPDPTFFAFCRHLLDRYETDQRVMMISGDNFQSDSCGPESYYFSNYSHIWGWASWRRAWEKFDLGMSTWPEFKRAGSLQEFCCGSREVAYWTDLFDRQYRGEIETWDYSWAYACWKHRGFTILPSQNLVSNIGFRQDGTHTLNPESHLANIPVTPLQRLIHPSVIARDWRADVATWQSIFCPPDLRAQETQVNSLDRLADRFRKDRRRPARIPA